MREIAREEWSKFLDSFSQDHEGWLATIEVLDEEIGAQVQVEEKTLGGITADLKDGENLISIIIGETLAERLTHNITAPTHLRIEQSKNGSDMALQIESENAATTLVRLRPQQAAGTDR